MVNTGRFANQNCINKYDLIIAIIEESVSIFQTTFPNKNILIHVFVVYQQAIITWKNDLGVHILTDNECLSLTSSYN